MGGIFSGEGKDGSSLPSFFLDFENAQPTDAEKDLYNQVQLVVEKHSSIMEKMTSYNGCTQLIQKAISQPTDDNKRVCWEALIPTVDVLKEFFLHAEELVKVFPLLLNAVCSSDPGATFSKHQALTKQLAGIFDFAMAFDEMKMSNPAISNDFSYYRRTMSAMKMSGKDIKVTVTDEMANKMSLFYAFPTPMLNVVKNCIQSDKCTQTDKTQIISGLSLMSCVCIHLVDKRKFSNTKILMYCLRAATGATIIVDALYEPGIFHPKAKKAPISARTTVNVLKNFTDEPTINLINTLRYNTKDADPKLFD